MTEKVCSKCGESKDSEVDFYHQKGRTNNSKVCKTCTIKKESARRATLKAAFEAEGPPTLQSKVCSICSESKTPDQFYVSKGTVSGLSCYCKECHRSYLKESRSKKVKERKKESFVYPSTKVCSICGTEKEFFAFAKDLRSSDRLQPSCRDCNNKRIVEKRKADAVHDLERIREKSRMSSRLYRARRKEDAKKGLLVPRGPEWTFIRSSVKRVLSLANKKKRATSEALLGYNASQLRARIEMNFKPGMTWSNYGRSWHIDHIIPVSFFLKKGETRPHIVNALCNLQPLWAAENHTKSARLPEFLARKQ